MAPEPSYRILFVSSHVVQYASPNFRLLAQHPRLDVLVAYCSLQGADTGFDPEFGLDLAWDVPLLDGYRWLQVPTRLGKPRLGSFLGLVNPGLWKLIRDGGFDAVFVFGHQYLSCWIAILATKLSRSGLIMSYDATTWTPQDSKSWKVPVKKLLLPRIFGLAEVICAASSGTAKLLESMSVSKERIILSPGTIDSTHLQKACRDYSREKLRDDWNIPQQAPVILFCGKLQAWKRPQDLLQAFAQAGVPESYLCFVGDGPMRSQLVASAGSLGVADRARFLGFMNQSRIAGAYLAADVLVLPSEYETFGLVVNEAMVCGLPVIVSDHVGARFDLVDGYGTGVVYPTGDVNALANVLREVLPDRERLQRMREAVRARMKTWSSKEKIESLFRAVETAVDRKQASCQR